MELTNERKRENGDISRKPDLEAVRQAYLRGFYHACRHIAKKLDEEGKGQTAAWVRKLKLEKK